uniref:Assembly chaperone of rpl4 n=1 Tax=Schistocephalus solidus TaxID=70667 RepID=A0A0X3Q812_SCHSO
MGKPNMNNKPAKVRRTELPGVCYNSSKAASSAYSPSALKHLSPKELLKKATRATDEFEPQQALNCYKAALSKLDSELPAEDSTSKVTEHLSMTLHCLQASAFILLELGKVEEARKLLNRAVSLSPDEGYEKYMYLAQLSEKKDAVELYLRGISVVNAAMEKAPDTAPQTAEATEDEGTVEPPPPTKAELKRALSNAYCAIAEIYMTDLCDEPEAEKECLAAVESATKADEKNPQAWLVTANFHLVKAQKQVARAALERCLSLYWPRVEAAISDLQGEKEDEESEDGKDTEKNTEDEDMDTDSLDNRLDLEELSGIPFEAHISMARMMMELEMNERAADVLEALLEEDDENAEVYYLISMVGQQLWKESDPERLRHYATMAKLFCAKEGDTELADEMDTLLQTLPAERTPSVSMGDGPMSSDSEDAEEKEETGEQNEGTS